jgi:hypothetical protein
VNRKPVSSSNLSSVGYDSDSKILEIEFNDHSVYRYYDVPSSIYEQLMSAASHGKYFHRNVKEHFRYEQIE